MVNPLTRVINAHYGFFSRPTCHHAENMRTQKLKKELWGNVIGRNDIKNAIAFNISTQHRSSGYNSGGLAITSRMSNSTKETEAVNNMSTY
jgi:hypothetical protein